MKKCKHDRVFTKGRRKGECVCGKTLVVECFKDLPKLVQDGFYDSVKNRQFEDDDQTRKWCVEIWNKTIGAYDKN